MRWSWIAIAVLSIWPTTAFADITANELLSSCEALVRQMRIENDQAFFTQDGYPCSFYLNAIQGVTRLSKPADPNRGLLGVCTPEDTRITQLIRIFTDYAQHKPAELHEPAWVIAIRAWTAAFPCR